jgi:AsmA protein
MIRFKIFHGRDSMKAAKVLTLLVGGVIGLCVLALLCVWLLVNPNEYKPRIQAAVKQATGRDLTLGGDLTLSVFPWVAINLGPSSLGNPAGFPAEPFLSFQHAAVRVKLWPLLSKRLEVGRLEIDGLAVKLIKDAQGRGNWEDFGTSSAAQAPAPGTAQAPGAAPAKPGAALEGIEGVELTNARLSYGAFVVQNLNLEIGAFSDRKVVPVSLHLDANRGVPGESGTMQLKLSLTTDSTTQRYVINALNLDGGVTLAAGARPLRVLLSAPAIDADLKAQTLSLEAFDLNADGAHLTGSVQGTRIIDAPDLTGTVQLAPLMVREFLPRIGVTPPVTRDEKALSTVAFSSRFHYGAKAAMLDDLEVTLDDTHLKGRAGITDLDTTALEFALAVDRIDLDRYRRREAAGCARYAHGGGGAPRAVGFDPGGGHAGREGSRHPPVSPQGAGVWWTVFGRYRVRQLRGHPGVVARRTSRGHRRG